VSIVTTLSTHIMMNPLAVDLMAAGSGNSAKNYVQKWANIITGVALVLVVISLTLAATKIAFKQGASAEGKKEMGNAVVSHAIGMAIVLGAWALVSAVTAGVRAVS